MNIIYLLTSKKINYMHEIHFSFALLCFSIQCTPLQQVANNLPDSGNANQQKIVAAS